MLSSTTVARPDLRAVLRPPGELLRSRRAVAAAAAGLAAAAVVVRLLARPGRPMWFDESVTVALARYPVRAILGQLVGAEVSGGPYTLLLHALLRVTDPLGLDALAVGRGASLAIGTATVPLLFLAGRRLVGDRAALLAAGLLAVGRFHVYYSLEARGYALAVLLVVLSTGALLALLERPRAAPALAFGALAALATWAHLFAAFVLAAQGLAALRHPGIRRAARWLGAGLALGGAGSAVVLVIAARGDAGQVGWIAPLSWKQVATVFVNLVGGARLLLVPAAAGAIVAAAAAREEGASGFGATLALAWALLPIALAVAVSVAKPLLVPRYLLVALPGFALLVAVGVQALRRPRLVAAAALLALALSGREVALDRYADPLWQPIDQVARRLLAVSRPGDALVVSNPGLAVTLERELARLGRAPGPERVDPPPGDPLALLPGPRRTIEERLASRTGVVFVLFAEGTDAARARAAFAAGARVADDEELRGVRLLRLERPAPAPAGPAVAP